MSDGPSKRKAAVASDHNNNDNDNNKSSSKQNKNKDRKRRRKNAPRPGEEGYKTPTQLRNARKRRAKKQRKGENNNNNNNNSDAKINNNNNKVKDPSSLYLSNPKSAPVVRAAQKYFEEQLSLPSFPIRVGPKRGWRTVSKLAVRPLEDDGQMAIGLFAPNSHKLVSVPDCPAHHDSINRTVGALVKLGRRLGVKPFDESTGTGLLRHVAINVERSSGRVQLTLVWNSQPYNNKQGQDEPTDDGQQLLDSFVKTIVARGGRKRRRGRKQKKDKCVDDDGVDDDDGVATGKEFELHSLWVHYNDSWKHDNAIFNIRGGPDSWQHRYGPTAVQETLMLPGQDHPIALRFPPNVFRQANLDAFAHIVAEIRKRLRGGDATETTTRRRKCVELYGGVGTIGLNIADLFSSLVSSDENPYNRQCFLEAAADLPEGVNVSYEPKNAADLVKTGVLETADVVVVDPPRKGLDDDTLDALCCINTATKKKKRPRLLVYVSCGFDAFQRDCEALVTKSNCWKLEHAEGHLLFPGSDAIETLAFFVSNT